MKAKGIAKAFTQALSLAFLLAPAACAPEGIDPESESYDSAGDSEGGILEDKALLATFQAEARTAASGCGPATNYSGYTGSGFIDYGGNGTWIEWDNISVATAGQYKLDFRYANAGSTPRQAATWVNGSKIGNVAFNGTGSWSTWSTASITVTLQAGNNRVRVMANTDAGGPNLDKMDVSSTVVAPSTISQVGTKSVYDFDGQGLTIARPSGVVNGDLMILILHRTDDYLPMKVDGWTRAAECYKRDNGYQCATAADCTSWSANGKFCNSFGSYYQYGQDLAQSIFYRTANNEPSSYRVDLNQDTSGHPGWAILTALRGAATTNPVRAWAHRGCDNNSDSLFPSVYGQAGDMLLLSQSFDDNISQSAFGAPSGTTLFGFINGDSGPAPDETGYLFGKLLTVTGSTGQMVTSGVGGSGCKDGLVSLTIKPQ